MCPPIRIAIIFVVVQLLNGGICFSADTPEAIVAKYHESLYQQKWKKAAAGIEETSLKRLQRLMSRVASDTTDADEQKQFLSVFGEVDSIEAYNRLSPTQAYERMLAGAWTLYSPETKEWWPKTSTQIIGSVPERELTHVVTRTTTHIKDNTVSVVSVATVKKNSDGFLIVTTQEFEKTLQKFRK